MNIESVLQNIETAMEHSFIEKYDEAVKLLHDTKKQLHSDSDAILLINVKLARCYEYLGDDEACQKYWNKALKQLELKDGKDSEILNQGRAELYINQFRALQHERGINMKEIEDIIVKISAVMNPSKPSLSTLQFMFMQINFYIRQRKKSLALEKCNECLQLIPEIKTKYQNPKSLDQDPAYEAARKYLSDFEKQVKGMKIFCQNQELIQEDSNQDVGEHEYEEWEEVSVRE